MDRLAFLNRFTASERAAIRTAAQSNVQIEDYLQLIAPGRGAEILAL